MAARAAHTVATALLRAEALHRAEGKGETFRKPSTEPCTCLVELLTLNKQGKKSRGKEQKRKVRKGGMYIQDSNHYIQVFPHYRAVKYQIYDRGSGHLLTTAMISHRD